MAFLLGSFTNGMFSGMNSVADVNEKEARAEYYRAQAESARQTTQQKDAAFKAGKSMIASGAEQRANAAFNAGQDLINGEAGTAHSGAASGGSAPGINLDDIPQPAHMQPAQEEQALPTPPVPPQTPPNYLPPASSSATNPGVPQAQGSMADRERAAYSQQGPNPGQRAVQALPTAPVITAPSNMPTYDVPTSQPGAFSSGQGTPQGTAAQTGPAPTPGGLGPDLSHLTNRPVGAAVGDWLHGRRPPAYIPPTPQAAPTVQQGTPISRATGGAQIGALPIGAQPTLASSEGGLGAQLLAAMQPQGGTG